MVRCPSEADAAAVSGTAILLYAFVKHDLLDYLLNHRRRIATALWSRHCSMAAYNSITWCLLLMSSSRTIARTCCWLCVRIAADPRFLRPCCDASQQVTLEHQLHPAATPLLCSCQSAAVSCHLWLCEPAKEIEAADLCVLPML